MSDKPMNVAQKLILSHLLEGNMVPGEEIALKVDQTLTQDATGTMVMLELEAMNIDKVKTEVSVQYVDHNLLREDNKNSDDELFLFSACQRYGIWYSRPGNGVSHPNHMAHFGIPGKTLLGSDSHTCSGGSLGMLAIGEGGLDVAMAMKGKPLYIKTPAIMGVKLTGTLPDWVSAKDVILEMLRRHGVKGGVGRIIEYYGPGLDSLYAMDRHTIANMGAELGATTSVFPSDQETRRFMALNGRGDDWQEIIADEGCEYDYQDEIELSELEPLIALPSSPGNVVPVSEVAGKEIAQSYLGSSANPAFRDFAIAAMMLDGQKVHEKVSFDLNPTSLQDVENLIELGYMMSFVRAGCRVHEPGCNGCIGMGQAPPSNGISLRTVPRNFPGRSGTLGDKVYLCSPETVTASAITGVITDPRTLGIPYPKYTEPEKIAINTTLFVPPLEDGRKMKLIKGPNIQSLPRFDTLPDSMELDVMLKVGNNISTDEILPAGAKVLPYRSNIPEISKFVFSQVDSTFYDRAIQHQRKGFAVIGGENYGQGSSREHAAIAPRYLGLRLVVAKSFARIHWQNLVNFGILPFTFNNAEDYDKIELGDEFYVEGLQNTLASDINLQIKNLTKDETYDVQHSLSNRQVKVILAGSLLNIP
ncbi:MAG TPA: aconitate hydratase [Candidatus Lokiarchaeia archaeon]|nr:aconitate hydratase [Candidatus Lokiarchaeia archaeon]